MTAIEPLDPAHCYRAMQAHDARFDGRFYTAVTSTRIYCRPVCRVKIPRLENCRFFRHASQAEQAGFRPCLRCRPELAPHDERWSIQDAGAVLARQAVRRLDELDTERGESSLPALARRIGISDRHLRRLFEQHLGVSPLQYLLTHRLHQAKQLLSDTEMSIAAVAQASGFASLRRFNDAFRAHYRMNPTGLRRQRSRGGQTGASVVRLGYRPPYDQAAMLGFLRTRAISSVESVADSPQAVYRRTLRVGSASNTVAGWIELRFERDSNRLEMRVDDRLHERLPLVIRRVRAALDLDADPAVIDRHLQTDFPGSAGMRVPGAFDGFELAVRAILGQQITVAAARTLAGRLVEHFGDAIETPFPTLGRLFPQPAVLARASADSLGAIGIIRQRQKAIQALAQSMESGTLTLSPAEDPHQCMHDLKALPGIGDWTAQYIAMRALRWPDAFPAGDVALQKALGVRDQQQAARAAEAASQAWAPWRSYAVIRCWHRLEPGPKASIEPIG